MGVAIMTDQLKGIMITRQPEAHHPYGIKVTCPSFSREYWFGGVDSASATIISPVSKPEHRLAASAALEWYKWN